MSFKESDKSKFLKQQKAIAHPGEASPKIALACVQAGSQCLPCSSCCVLDVHSSGHRL